MRPVHFIATLIGIATFIAMFLGLRGLWNETSTGIAGLVVSLHVGWAIIDWRAMINIYADTVTRLLTWLFAKIEIDRFGRTDRFVGLTVLLKFAVTLATPIIIGVQLFWLQLDLLGVNAYGKTAMGMMVDNFFVDMFSAATVALAMSVLWLTPMMMRDNPHYEPPQYSSWERLHHVGMIIGGAVAVLLFHDVAWVLVLAASLAFMGFCLLCLGTFVLAGMLRIAGHNVFATTTISIVAGDVVAWIQMAGQELNTFEVIQTFLIASGIGLIAGVSMFAVGRYGRPVLDRVQIEF